jgi:hypothetical protein
MPQGMLRTDLRAPIQAVWKRKEDSGRNQLPSTSIAALAGQEFGGFLGIIAYYRASGRWQTIARRFVFLEE